MLDGSELLRFAEAMLCSGIFWATLLFLLNACALDHHVPFLGVGAATGLLVLMVYLFAGVVTSAEAFMPSATALFYSGIFWMMVLFVVERRRIPASTRKPLLPVALVLMIGSAYLILGVIAHPRESVTPLDAALERSTDFVTGK